MPFGWGEEFNKVPCPGGKIRYVIKKMSDMGKAFSLYAPEVDYLVKGSLRTAQMIAEGGGEVEVKKKAEQIFENLDSIHIDAVTKFTMHYTVFMASPCDEAAYDNLSKAIDKISESIDTLRRLVTEMDRLKNKHLGGSAAEAIGNIGIIEGLLTDLGQAYKPE